MCGMEMLIRTERMYSGDQITYWLIFRTPHLAAVGTAWSLLGSPRNGPNSLHYTSFRNILSCQEYIHGFSHRGRCSNVLWCWRSVTMNSHCYQLASSPARRLDLLSCHCDMYRQELAINCPALLNYMKFWWRKYCSERFDIHRLNSLCRFHFDWSNWGRLHSD
jgi:hypothetical protein